MQSNFAKWPPRVGVTAGGGEGANPENKVAAVFLCKEPS